MKYLVILFIGLLASCSDDGGIGGSRNTSTKQTLKDARSSHKTQLIKKDQVGYPVSTPPLMHFRQVSYPAPLGDFPAYISTHGDSDVARPAIIWLVGGFGNSISDTAWASASKENDQSASTFWTNGIVTMYPSLRGGNENEGYLESFYGEVDDVIAAAEFLKTQPGVDPDRIYLGGHSTGGTLALLVAESYDGFRAVFSLGPVDDPAGYSQDYLAYDVDDPIETKTRAPIHWLHCISSPTFIMEGSDGNVDSLMEMKRVNENPLIHFHPLDGYDHFNIIQPISKLLVQKIKADMGDEVAISLTTQEIKQALKQAYN